MTTNRKPAHLRKATPLVWAIGIVFLLVGILGLGLMARDIAQGHLLKPIVIGVLACIGGWRAYKQAKASSQA